MKKWLRRIRAAVGMGLAWAAGWALVGVLMGVTSLLLPGLPWDRFFAVFDAPLPALAVPGFVGGAIFQSCSGLSRAGADFLSCHCRYSLSAERWVGCYSLKSRIRWLCWDWGPPLGA